MRKSNVALIYHTVAHPGKAVWFTKETPNLLGNMLNIPLCLGTKTSAPSFHLSILQACILFYCWFSTKTRKKESGKERIVGLAWRWKEGRSFGHSMRWILLNWNRFSWVWGYVHINHCNYKAESLRRNFDLTLDVEVVAYSLFQFLLLSSWIISGKKWFFLDWTGLRMTLAIFSESSWEKMEITIATVCQPAACQSKLKTRVHWWWKPVWLTKN